MIAVFKLHFLWPSTLVVEASRTVDLSTVSLQTNLESLIHGNPKTLFNLKKLGKGNLFPVWTKTLIIVF